MRVLLTALLCAGALCAKSVLHGAGLAHAQAYPNRPIRIVVPFPAGGPTDGMARIISDRLGTVPGQNIIVENRARRRRQLGGRSSPPPTPTATPSCVTPGRRADLRPGRAQEYRLRSERRRSCRSAMLMITPNAHVGSPRTCR